QHIIGRRALRGPARAGRCVAREVVVPRHAVVSVKPPGTGTDPEVPLAVEVHGVHNAEAPALRGLAEGLPNLAIEVGDSLTPSEPHPARAVRDDMSNGVARETA